MLRANAPHLRTSEAILAKNEQILDGMERGAVTPKMAEQMGQCCKMPIALAKLELAYVRMAAVLGRKAPVPRSPILRSVLGLPESISPTDGATMRALVGAAE